MKNELPLIIFIVMMLTMIIVPVHGAIVPTIDCNKDIVPRQLDSGARNAFIISYTGERSTTYDGFITNNIDNNVPRLLVDLSRTDGHTNVSMVSPTQFTLVTSKTGTAILYFETTSITTPAKYNFSIVDPSGSTPTVIKTVDVIDPSFVPTPTTPTSTITTLVTTSPVVQEITVLVTTTSTPTPTTVKTTSTVTKPTATMVVEQTETTVVRPTSKVNHTATIERLEKQLADQQSQIDHQQSFIDSILKFLGII